MNTFIQILVIVAALCVSIPAFYLSLSFAAALGAIRRDYKKGGSIWKYNDSVFGTRRFKGSIFGEKPYLSLRSSKSTGIIVRGRAQNINNS